jgi:hypothetical protein
MKRHFYISEDLDDLEHVEEELEASGLSTPQIHVLSNDDSAVAEHDHLHSVEAVLKKDVVYGTEIGALVGVIAAAIVIAVAYFTGWPETMTWVPFIFLAVVLLGFCTWEGGLFGIQKPHHQFERFQSILNEGKHIFFVDVDADQEDALEKIVSAHPRLEPAGLGEATPAWVVKGQKKFHDAVESLP